MSLQAYLSGIFAAIPCCLCHACCIALAIHLHLPTLAPELISVMMRSTPYVAAYTTGSESLRFLAQHCTPNGLQDYGVWQSCAQEDPEGLHYEAQHFPNKFLTYVS